MELDIISDEVADEYQALADKGELGPEETVELHTYNRYAEWSSLFDRLEQD